MVDQVLLNDTLQKINASLNKRFEKDADLYISKQDEYEIKKNLCNEAYGGVVDMAKAKGINHDIIVKVIMRNAGVLNVHDAGKFKRELKPILEDANYRALSYMMEDVLANNVYMQKDIRHILFSYYMSGVTANARINYWKERAFKFDMIERAALFNLIIEKTKHKDPSKTLKFKTDFIEDALKRYPSLMNRKDNVFNKLKNTLNEGEKKEFFEYLCSEMEQPAIENEAYNLILIAAYASYGEAAFNDAINRIKAASPTNFKQYINVICKLFWEEKDKDTLVRMFDTVCRAYESAYIKRHIKCEIGKKVWKTAKKNAVLYEARKAKIDRLMSDLEETNKSKYSSFDDIAMELSDDGKPKNIAYFWINMKSPDFEQSIMESFTKLNVRYLWPMHETYDWLFKHSIKKGDIKELRWLCERLSQPLHDFSTGNSSSDFYDTLDGLWVSNVVKYKLQGQKIKEYMFEKHFDKVKEWE